MFVDEKGIVKVPIYEGMDLENYVELKKHANSFKKQVSLIRELRNQPEVCINGHTRKHVGW